MPFASFRSLACFRIKALAHESRTTGRPAEDDQGSGTAQRDSKKQSIALLYSSRSSTRFNYDQRANYYILSTISCGKAGDKVVDKITRKFSSPYVSPYLRRPLRSLSDALSEQKTTISYQSHEQRHPAHGEGSSTLQREGRSA